MKTIDTNLCFGGPYDGERIEQRGDRFTVIEKGSGRETEYRRERFHGDEVTFTYWCHQTVTADDVIRSLFAGLAEPKTPVAEVVVTGLVRVHGKAVPVSAIEALVDPAALRGFQPC